MISILKEKCGYISKKYILYYKYDGRALAIENDQNWKADISLHNHGDKVLNFEMSNRRNGTYSSYKTSLAKLPGVVASF